VLRAFAAAALLAGAGYAAATFVAAPGRAAGPVLNASVGPGYTISLMQNGSPVTTLAPGQYTVNVSDNSDMHNFHLTGPGEFSQTTGVAFIGTTSWDVTFSAGTYNFQCDPHSYEMNGTFTVAPSSTTTTSSSTSTTTTAPPSTSTTTSSTTSTATSTTTGTTTTSTSGTTTTSSPTPPAVTAAAVVQSLRVSATGRRGSRVVFVRIDLSKAAPVRVRLLRGLRAVASLRRAIGAQPKTLRLRVPRTAPGGRYRLEIVVLRSPKPQRMVRTITLRP
jgi:plastocyanin